MTRLRFLITVGLAGLGAFFGRRTRGGFRAEFRVASKPVHPGFGYVISHRGIRRDPFPETLMRGGMSWKLSDVVNDPRGSRCAFYGNEEFPCAAVWEDGQFWVYDYLRNEWTELA